MYKLLFHLMLKKFLLNVLNVYQRKFNLQRRIWVLVNCLLCMTLNKYNYFLVSPTFKELDLCWSLSFYLIQQLKFWHFKEFVPRVHIFSTGGVTKYNHKNIIYRQYYCSLFGLSIFANQTFALAKKCIDWRKILVSN